MFGRSPFLEPEISDWHVKCWAWLIDATGGLEDLRQTKLVLANADFFPPSEATGHARAEHILECVKTWAGMPEWQTRLVAQPGLARRVSSLGSVTNGAHPAGTFCRTGNQGKISYDPDLLSRPVALIATLTHELGHYLNGTFKYPPPEGVDYFEPATDVTACFLGFGLFGANSAFEFEQFTDFDSQGWRSSTLGYLSQREWLLNLAIFIALTGASPDDAKAELKPALRGDFKRALKFVEAENLAEKVKQEIGRH